MKKYKVLLSFFARLIFSFLCFVGYLFYLPSEERQFVSILKEGIENSADNKFQLSKLYGGEWDRVCAIGKYDYLKSDRQEYRRNFFGADYTGEDIDLPVVRWPKFKWALVFLNTDKSVKVLNLVGSLFLQVKEEASLARFILII